MLLKGLGVDGVCLRAPLYDPMIVVAVLTLHDGPWKQNRDQLVADKTSLTSASTSAFGFKATAWPLLRGAGLTPLVIDYLPCPSRYPQWNWLQNCLSEDPSPKPWVYAPPLLLELSYSTGAQTQIL